MQSKIFLAQSTGNPMAPHVGKPDGFTPQNVTMLIIICMPIILFTGILGRNAYQQHRARTLKQNIMKLERAWKAPSKEKQDH